MMLKPEQLQARLKKGLNPVYLVSGDEPLLVQEAADAIRSHARAAGHQEREVMNVETGFDWNTLLAASDSLSLFGERRIIELRLAASKLPEAGAKVLEAYAVRPAEDAVLLITCGKLDAAAQRSKWFQTVERAGIVVQVWPVEARQLPAWIAQRMRGRGMMPSDEAVALLVERVEGNLLAAAQEIEKLLLLHGAGPLDAEAVAESVGNSARFDVYGLADGVLEGNAARIVRILSGLKGEGTEPVLVLWALAREVRSLSAMAYEVARGAQVDAVLARHRVWERRKPLVKAGLKRCGVARWQALLRRCGQVDRVIKGAAPGRAWDELLQLSMQIAGVNVLGPRRSSGSGEHGMQAGDRRPGH